MNKKKIIFLLVCIITVQPTLYSIPNIPLLIWGTGSSAVKFCFRNWKTVAGITITTAGLAWYLRSRAMLRNKPTVVDNRFENLKQITNQSNNDKKPIVVPKKESDSKENQKTVQQQNASNFLKEISKEEQIKKHTKNLSDIIRTYEITDKKIPTPQAFPKFLNLLNKEFEKMPLEMQNEILQAKYEQSVPKTMSYLQWIADDVKEGMLSCLGYHLRNSKNPINEATTLFKTIPVALRKEMLLCDGSLVQKMFNRTPLEETVKSWYLQEKLHTIKK